jgi:hypothetical protein
VYWVSLLTRVNFLAIRQVDAVPSPPAPPVSDSRSALLRQIQVAWEGLAEVHGSTEVEIISKNCPPNMDDFFQYLTSEDRKIRNFQKKVSSLSSKMMDI